MNDPTEPQDHDEALLAEWFDAFLDDVLEGRFTDIDALIDRRPDLEERIRETQILAHQLAGRRLPTTPTVDGYEIVRELGRGGMGAVFLARPVGSDRQIALKVLPSSFGLSDRARARFLSEARALAQVSDEHIVRIHNVIANDEALAFEMEFVDGPTLREVSDRLRSKGRDATLSDIVEVLGDGAVRPPERTLLQWCVRVVATIARALAHVHRAGLVHRDVKPSNILLRRDGTPLLADFGLVRDLASSATRTEAFVGTLNYAAPEQLRADADACDARSDVYSLAATLWELVVGAPPHLARSAVDALRRIEAHGAPRLRKVVPDAPRDLATILEKAMDPDPAARYPTADALADDLDLLLRWQPIHARAPSGLVRIGRRLRRHRRTLVAAGVGATLLAIAVAVPVWLAAEREDRSRRADALAREARADLVSRPSRERAYRQLILGFRPEFEWVKRLGDPDASDLQSSLRAFRSALALAPDRRDLAQETLLVAIASGPGPTTAVLELVPGMDFDLSSLSPVVREYAAPWAEGRIESGFLPVRLDDATLEDRRAIGLLAFLNSDVVNCEAAWSGLDPVATDAPLTDAGLGLLYAVDDRPERAYPRLLQAIRTFPDSAVLAVTLAEVAVALGDTDLGERWIRRAERLRADPTDVAIARADLLRARGDLAGSRAALATLEPTGARVALRLARLEFADGEPHRSSDRLIELIGRHPNLLRARLELGRNSLAESNRALYLEQVEWVAANDFAANRSPGTVRDAADLFRAGGLQALAARTIGRSPGIGTRGAWVEATFQRQGFEDPAQIEDLVLRRRALAIDLRANFPRPSSRGPVGRAADALARAVGLSTWFPELSAAWSADQRVALGCVGIVARLNWPGLVGDLLPSLLGGLESYAIVDARTLDRQGGGADDLLGSVAAAGDVDGDGIADYICGTFRDPELGPGFLRCVSGHRGEVLFEVRGLAVGFTCAAIGDLDRDGRDDFAHVEVLGEPDQTSETVVQVRSGASGDVLRTFRDAGRTSTFGSSIAAIGDVDRDGIVDLAITSMGETGGVGFVRIYSGATGDEVATAYGPRGASFGVSLATIADQDGDGCRDLLVGALAADGARGRVWLLSSRTGTSLDELTGGPDRMLFGVSLATGADLDGDGVEDFAVGATAGDVPGSILLFSGRDRRQLASIEDGPRAQGLGGSIALCDVDGDGIADVIGGVNMSSESGPRSGQVLVWSGRSIRDGREPELIADLRGDAPGAELGAALAALPDHFGPGFGALVVTGPGFSVDAPNGGAAWLVSPWLDPATARRRLDARRR